MRVFRGEKWGSEKSKLNLEIRHIFKIPIWRKQNYHPEKVAKYDFKKLHSFIEKI